MPTRRDLAAPMTPNSILVLGIGNVLWADEGFGVRVLEALHQRFTFPDHVSLLDGGTQGVYLLPHVTAADAVLVLDCIDLALPPGTLKTLRDAEVPVWTGQALSLHQATFQELLALAHWQGRFPSRITVIGVQPAVLDDLGGSLSASVRARLDEAVGLAVAELAAWGVNALPLDAQATERAEGEGALHPQALTIDAYETGRPDAALACRVGDERFMQQRTTPDARSA
jgi:hydrogenase maturation protease